MLSTRFFNFAKKLVPRISETERIALTCGSIGFDREIFSGNPNYNSLLKYDVSLSDAEDKFLNKTLNDICSKVNDYQIMKTQNIQDSNLDNLKKSGIFGMLINPEMGGLNFSTHARSQIVQKLSSRSGSLGVVAMVPNSLGPGELLIKYGNQEQKDKYLPKLSSGEMIPCFGLTSWAAGSDAAGSMIDKGVVKSKKGKLYIDLSVNKRYITLAPIADLVGLAFKLEDPHKLLKDGKEGITLVILEKDKFPNMQIGNRHDPLGAAFPNGTIYAKNMEIPMDTVIGGEEMCGNGWRMLMECLSEGRAVSLPATAVGASKLATVGTGAYSRVRQQFRTPIADMEGVQEKIADMVKDTFIITSGQFLTNALLDNGEKPSVISAVLKQQATERARGVLNHGMDIMGGAGICMGPNNILASSYIQSPIGITVEGSNTLTRSLIIFGQGLMRSHPYLFNMVDSIVEDNKKMFYENLRGLVSDSIKNTLLSISPKIPTNDPKKQLIQLSRSFALTSNMMLLMGKKFKTSEMLSGRLADIFGNIYLSYSLLWYHEKYCPKDSQTDKLLKYCLNSLMYDIQEDFYEVSANYPNSLVGTYIKMVSFPYGKRFSKSTDEEKREISDLVTNPSGVFELLKENIYIPNESEHLGTMIKTMNMIDKNSIDDVDTILDLREQISQVNSFEKL
jgi:acyl-CoA dehydrogenase